MYAIYPCRDGYLRLIILSPRQWRAMRAWLGEPEYLQEPVLDTFLARIDLAPVLTPLYTELFSTMTREEVAIEAQRRGIACTPVLAPDEVLECRHLVERRTFVPLMTGDDAVPHFAGWFDVDGRRAQPSGGVAPKERTPTAHPVPEWFAAAGHQERPVPPLEAPSLPFEGVRVLDFGIGGVGVEAARLFGEYGADVIKIETRSYPDFMRTISGSEMSPSFASASRSKRSFGVNAKHPTGREIVLDLVAASDVVIENSSTGTMDGLGLGDATLRSRNPRLVMISSQLLGTHGPWADWIGYGPSTQTVGGLVHLWDYDDEDPPAGSQMVYPDHLAGRLCALGAAAGLLAARGSGTGAHIELAQVDVVVGLLGDVLMHAALEPGSERPRGNRRPDGAPWGVYPCAGKQEWCVITVRDDEWSRLGHALGDPEWATRPELATAAGRHASHDEIDMRLGEWTATLDKYEVARLLQNHGIACGPMLTGDDQIDDPHFEARGYSAPRVQQDVGPMTFEGPAFSATGMAPARIEQAPRLGEHTMSICREVLGLDEDTIHALVADGILDLAPQEERR
jgi:crotonobetainyl-CoA:carnitine CoA-transferase CaiB-like acyl-CoA transferase